MYIDILFIVNNWHYAFNKVFIEVRKEGFPIEFFLQPEKLSPNDY